MGEGSYVSKAGNIFLPIFDVRVEFGIRLRSMIPPPGFHEKHFNPSAAKFAQASYLHQATSSP